MVNLPFFVFVKGSTTWFIFDLFKVGKRLGVAADALPWAGCAEGGSNPLEGLGISHTVDGMEILEAG